MGRRAKVDIFGLLERVVDMFECQKMQIEEIAEVLQGEGYAVSSSAIQRSLKSNHEVAIKYRRALDESRLLLKEVQGNTGTEIMEVAQQILAQRLAEYVRSIDELSFKSAGELADAVASISNAQVNVSRLKMEFERGVNTAKQALEAELTRLLTDTQPETLLAVLDAIERIDVKPTRGRI